MTSVVHSQLAELEEVIENGLKTFVEVGMALAEIRNERLYDVDHGGADTSIGVSPMQATVTVNWKIVEEGRFEYSYPLTSEALPERRPSEEDAPREDRVLPMGSSTLAPGMTLRLARPESISRGSSRHND